MPWNNPEKRTRISFDVKRLLESVGGYKGLDFPMAWAGKDPHKGTELADNGTVLRRQDLLGGYYFLPVTFMAGGQQYEIDCAMVRLRLRKTVVGTPLSGKGGTVKELVGTQDMEVSVAGCLMGERGKWPEERINGLRRLFGINDSVSLKCALTDCFFEAEDKVVITGMDFPQDGQAEDVVPVRIECVQDKVFELKID